MPAETGSQTVCLGFSSDLPSHTVHLSRDRGTVPRECRAISTSCSMGVSRETRSPRADRADIAPQSLFARLTVRVWRVQAGAVCSGCAGGDCDQHAVQRGSDPCPVTVPGPGDQGSPRGGYVPFAPSQPGSPWIGQTIGGAPGIWRRPCPRRWTAASWTRRWRAAGATCCLRWLSGPGGPALPMC